MHLWTTDNPRFLGFGVVSRNDNIMTFSFFSDLRQEIQLQLPSWFLLLLFSLLPAKQLHRFIQQRRRVGINCCPTCRYDLRAHHPGEKCPECGTAILVPATSMPIVK